MESRLDRFAARTGAGRARRMMVLLYELFCQTGPKPDQKTEVRSQKSGIVHRMTGIGDKTAAVVDRCF